MLRNLSVSVLALLPAAAGCARHAASPPSAPAALAPQSRLGPSADFGPGIVAVTSSDVDLALDAPAYVIALRVTRELGIQVIAPLAGTPRSKRGTQYFRGGASSKADATTSVSSRPCTIRADSRESCVGMSSRYRITQLVPGGASPDAEGYWLLIVSDAPTPAREVMRRLELMSLVDTTLVGLVRSIPEPMIASRSARWAAYYAAFGTPMDP